VRTLLLLLAGAESRTLYATDARPASSVVLSGARDVIHSSAAETMTPLIRDRRRAWRALAAGIESRGRTMSREATRYPVGKLLVCCQVARSHPAADR